MILQAALPHTPWADPALARMPGMRPVEGSWIVVDDAYAPQMAERARLVAARPEAVMTALPESEDIQADALETVLRDLPPGFDRTAGRIVCPDGRRIDVGAPLPTLAATIQEDVLLLDARGAEHVLVAGLLCFPASWTLAEKLGHPLSRIHAPVPGYAGDLATRVQRLFDRVPAGRPMWRMNALGYAEPALHQPRPEAARRDDAAARYLRCERQTVLRLPRTGAILFAVHTYVLRPDALTAAQRATCPIAIA